MFGLSPQWLPDERGRPVADALVLSHPEQYDRERYRRALGVRPGQRLVVLSSTWNPESLFGDALPDLLPRLDPALPLRPQLTQLIDTHSPLPTTAAFTSSVPGESATRLRRLFYGVIGIPEPDAPALLEPLPLPPFEPVAHPVP
ncbi:hypothetical protein [Streptomyces hokutonensis]|uniref:hypothetical protein n=1 Tax=Streptomyces hokutonensis TaxID=1306990 RepID=UPI0033E38153